MALLLTTSLFVLIFLWVTGHYLRSRDPLLRDVMLMFTSVAMLFVLAAVRVFTGTPAHTLTAVALVLLLAKPLFTLRVVGRLCSVPSWWWPAALVAWLLTASPVLLSVPAEPLRPVQLWPAVITFLVVETVAAWLLGKQARRRRGAARTRLWCAAAGTALFGAAVLVAAGGASVAAGARTLAVAAGILNLLAFAPPRWLVRMLAQNAAYTVTRRLLAAPTETPTDRTWQTYCQGAAEALGADAVVVLLPASTDAVYLAGSFGPVPDAVDCTRQDLDELTTGPATIDALAGWTKPPAVAMMLAQASDTRYVTVAPVSAPEGRGALLLLNCYRDLFPEHDVTAFTDLAGQAMALADRARTLAESERLAVIVESSHDAIVGMNLDGTIAVGTAAPNGSTDTGATRCSAGRRPCCSRRGRTTWRAISCNSSRTASVSTSSR